MLNRADSPNPDFSEVVGSTRAIIRPRILLASYRRNQNLSQDIRLSSALLVETHTIAPKANTGSPFFEQRGHGLEARSIRITSDCQTIHSQTIHHPTGGPREQLGIEAPREGS